MTPRQKYEAFIAALPAHLAWQIDADAQDNAFVVAVTDPVSDDDDRWRCALETAVAMADDPKSYGIKA